MSQTQPERDRMRRTEPEERPPVVVAAVDGGPGGERVLAAAGRLAARTGARVVVAHVQPTFSGAVDGEALVDLRRDLEYKVVTQATNALDPLRVRWQLDVEPGRPAYAIHQIADRNDAALVIVGSCGSGLRVALRRLLRRSVSTYLIRHEARPVLVVPPSRSR